MSSKWMVIAGSMLGSAAAKAGVSDTQAAYFVDWSPEASGVPTLSLPLVIALAGLLLIVAIRVLRQDGAASAKVRGLLLVGALGGLVLGGGDRLVAAVSATLEAGPGECADTEPVLPDDACTISPSPTFKNSCGAPVVVSYRASDLQCFPLGTVPSGSVVGDGETADLPLCSVDFCTPPDPNEGIKII